MRAVDSSVIIAALATWHVMHLPARSVLAARPALIAHCALESYSVLTRLPVPHRMPAPVVAELLGNHVAGAPLVLPAGALAGLPAAWARAGIVGGAVYDALVATTAAHHGATLVTLDRRALDTYRKVGVSVEVLDGRMG